MTTIELSDALVQTWVTGWARTHSYEVHNEGRVHNARPADGEEWEYVLFAPEDTELRKVASAVAKNPHRLLTVIAEPDDDVLAVREIEGLELLSDEERLMVADMGIQDVEQPIIPEEFTTAREDYADWTLFSVREGENTAARGRVAVVDEFCIIDRVYTSPDYRRQGLGTLVTRALLAIALEHEVEHGLLVATLDGVQLYEYLGWETLAEVHVFGAPGTEDRRRPSHSQIDEEISA